VTVNAPQALTSGGLWRRRTAITGLLKRQTLDARCLDVGSLLGDVAALVRVDARLSRVFDPFVITKPHGMGMGLAISRTIVDAHGGQIWAENKAGGGAAFRFTLPIAGEAVAS
jgi:hypothetical protein